MKLPNIPSLIGQGIGHVVHVPVDLFCGIKKGFIDAGRDELAEAAAKAIVKAGTPKAPPKKRARKATKATVKDTPVTKINKAANDLPPHDPVTGEVTK